MEFLELSLKFTLLIGVLSLILLWLFIKSAVKSGTKAALEEFYYSHFDKNKTKIEDEVKKELEGWK